MRETIICYDICCPRRLGRIHRYLKRVACPLQYSVFLFTGTAPQLERCLARLSQIMDPREDDLRAYPLPERGYRMCFGKATLPEGIHWSGLPQPWQGTASHREQGPTDPTAPLE